MDFSVVGSDDIVEVEQKRDEGLVDARADGDSVVWVLAEYGPP
jgi:hypothetical protein